MDNGAIYITNDYSMPESAGGPTWKSVKLADLGIRGVLQDAIPDVFDEFHTWVVTDTEIGLLVNNGDTYTYTVQHRYGLWHRVSLKVRRALASLKWRATHRPYRVTLPTSK